MKKKFKNILLLGIILVSGLMISCGDDSKKDEPNPPAVTPAEPLPDEPTPGNPDLEEPTPGNPDPEEPTPENPIVSWINPSHLDFPYTGGSRKVEFGCAANWKIENSDNEWIKLSKYSGFASVSDILIVTVAPNESAQERTSIITIATEGNENLQIEITQSAMDNAVSVPDMPIITW